MASRSSSCKTTPAARPGSRFCKGVVVSIPPAFRSNSKSDELRAPEKCISASSYASAPVLAESILAFKYSKVDLMRILKIFSKSKDQKPKAKVPRKRPLKAKVPDVYFGKLHMDCYHFYQQYEDHFEIDNATRSNCTLFAALFLCGKINFQRHQHQK